MIECTRCNKGNQYIGHSTVPLRTQLEKHMKESTIENSFLQRTGHDFKKDTRVTILQMTTKYLLLEKEKTWIKLMETTHPKGLNSTTS